MIALRVFYDGEGFFGAQAQPGRRTVQGELERAFAALGTPARVRLASRTDRGVSAIGQVAAADVPPRDFHPGALNDGLGPDLRAWAWAEVGEFNPRHADGKEYAYAYPGRLDLGAVRESAALLVGEHDYSNLCRHDNRLRRPTTAALESIEAEESGGATVLTFRAPYFLYELVRRTTTLLARVGSGEAGLDEVRRALDPSAVVNIPPADPRWLCLLRVWYRDEPGWRAWRPGREAVERFARRLAEGGRARQGMAGAILGRLTPPGG